MKYIWVINEIILDGSILRCDIGVRNDNNIDQKEFLRIIRESSAVELDAADMRMLVHLATELEASGCNSRLEDADDTWGVLFMYNGKDYGGLTGFMKSEPFEMLIDEFIRLSPISIDLVGFS